MSCGLSDRGRWMNDMGKWKKLVKKKHKSRREDGDRRETEREKE